MKKAGWTFRRLLIVTYFFITVPLLIAGIVSINIERLDNTAYYFSSNRMEEIPQILRVLLRQDAPENTVQEVSNLNDEDLFNRFLSKNPNEEKYFREYLDWKLNSRQFAIHYLSYNTVDNLEKHYRASEVIKLILLDLSAILIYILLTDFLAKTLSYIIEWEFGWWINYKNLFRKKS